MKSIHESTPSGGGRGKNKRFWTTEEDKVLIIALSDLAKDPHWKCGNGFKNGYMVRLEEVINKAIPGCGLKALPHIDSRLKTLVTKFRVIVQMLGTSGFKWDDEKCMISVERSVYDEYCKIHPNCKNLYGQYFPHFNALMEIYGKDYATGKPAEGIVDAIVNVEKSIPVQILCDSSDDEHISGNDIQTVESVPPSKKVKRENDSELEDGNKERETASSSELANLQSFMKDVGHLSTMANVMLRADECEQKVDERSEKVLDELFSLEGITPQQALEVAQILTAQPHKLLIFFKCPHALRVMFVKSLLGRNDFEGGDQEHESPIGSELATLQAFMKDVIGYLSTMATVMLRAEEREQKVAERREKVLDKLFSLDGITPQQALEVAQILIAQPQKLLIFSKCPHALRVMFVKSLLVL